MRFEHGNIDADSLVSFTKSCYKRTICIDLHEITVLIYYVLKTFYRRLWGFFWRNLVNFSSVGADGLFGRGLSILYQKRFANVYTCTAYTCAAYHLPMSAGWISGNFYEYFEVADFPCQHTIHDFHAVCHHEKPIIILKRNFVVGRNYICRIFVHHLCKRQARAER